MAKEEVKEKVIKQFIVKELPQVEARTATLQDGTEGELITVEEALEEILGTVREIKQNLIGR